MTCLLTTEILIHTFVSSHFLKGKESKKFTNFLINDNILNYRVSLDFILHWIIILHALT